MCVHTHVVFKSDNDRSRKRKNLNSRTVRSHVCARCVCMHMFMHITTHIVRHVKCADECAVGGWWWWWWRHGGTTYIFLGESTQDIPVCHTNRTHSFTLTAKSVAHTCPFLSISLAFTLSDKQSSAHWGKSPRSFDVHTA